MPSDSKMMVVGKDYNSAVAAEPFAVYGNGGRVGGAAPRVQYNIGYVPAPYTPPAAYDEYAYPGRKFGVEKLYAHTRAPEGDAVVTPAYNGRAVRKIYVKNKRAIGAVFVGISVALLIVAACFLI